MKATIKALALMSLGLFLYSRFWNGNLFFYIHERFVWLIIFAAIGLVIIGGSYSYRANRQKSESHDHDHDGHRHSAFSWSSIILLMLPVVLGLAVPPKPLGASAMVNRDVSMESLTSASAPDSSEVVSKPKGDRNVLDWLIDFRSVQDVTVFEDEAVNVVGFVYRDDRFSEQQFMVSRFVVSCCAADAAPIGLVVQWPNSAELPDDEWVTVKGPLRVETFAGEEMPIVIAESVTPTDIPERPYLYPF